MESYLPRDAQKLTFNTDFRRAYSRGKCFRFPDVVVYVNKNRTGTVRYGITSSKKIGNAVTRNRARRVIRAAYYSSDVAVKKGYDIVFVARSVTAARKSTDLVPHIQNALSRYSPAPDKNETAADKSDPVLPT